MGPDRVLRADAAKTDPYVDAVFARIGEHVAEDRNTIWIRDIRPGLLEYVTTRVMEWCNDANAPYMRLCIASDGGDLDEAIGIYSLLRSLPKPTIAHVFWAYSGGVIVALGCDVRVGFEATTVLVHDPWVNVEGRSDYISDHVQGFELKRKLIRDIFLKRTRLTSRKLNSVARKEWWLDKDAALKYGILTDELEWNHEPHQTPEDREKGGRRDLGDSRGRKKRIARKRITAQGQEERPRGNPNPRAMGSNHR